MGLRRKKLSKEERVSSSFANTSTLTEGRPEKYMKKLLGTTNIEDSLKRLDKLTQEEARMATAQVLKVTHTIDEGVRGVADKVVGVDDRVASVDKRVAGVDRRVEVVDNRVAGVDNKLEAVGHRVTSVDDRVADVGDSVRTVDNKVAVIIEGAQIIFSRPSNGLFNHSVPDGKEARVVMQQAASDVDQMKRWSFRNNIDIVVRTGSTVLAGNQLRQDLRRWLSPPDPSTNHNIACSAHHKGTATWFFQGGIFGEWKTTYSLLWVHGKRMFSTVSPNGTI